MALMIIMTLITLIMKIIKKMKMKIMKKMKNMKIMKKMKNMKMMRMNMLMKVGYDDSYLVMKVVTFCLWRFFFAIFDVAKVDIQTTWISSWRV